VVASVREVCAFLDDFYSDPGNKGEPVALALMTDHTIGAKKMIELYKLRQRFQQGSHD
jgi:hypothetical protein